MFDLPLVHLLIHNRLNRPINVTGMESLVNTQDAELHVTDELSMDAFKTEDQFVVHLQVV